MFNLLGNIPKKVGLALSGGIDSMSILHFLLRGYRDVTVVHVNHGTEHARFAEEFVKQICEEYDLELFLRHVDGSSVESNYEAQWRKMRYEAFDEFHDLYGLNLITGHHLDDCLETWLFSSLHGKPKTIPYKRDYIIRPFLLTCEEKIKDYADRNDIPFISDPSNNDYNYMRNFIRHKLVPEALIVNPGLHKMVAKIVKSRYNKLYG